MREIIINLATHTCQPSSINNPYAAFSGLSQSTAEVAYYFGQKAFGLVNHVLGALFHKKIEIVSTGVSKHANEPFGTADEPKHIHVITDPASNVVTTPSTRAASVRSNSPEAIEKDDDFTKELDLFFRAGQLDLAARSDGLLVTPRASTLELAKDYTAEEIAEIEAFIQQVLAEDNHDPLEDSIVFTEEDSLVFEEVEEAATTPKAPTKEVKTTVKKAAPVIKMTRAQQLLAAEIAAKLKADKDAAAKKASVTTAKKPSGKKAAVKR